MWFKTDEMPSKQQVCTVSRAVQLLKMTRRHLYRCMASGHIRKYAKILGEWLVNYDDVQKLHTQPLFSQPLPMRLQIYFPEYDVSTLNAGRDRLLIISRLLAWGGMTDLKWLMKRYSKEDIANVIQNHGERYLSPKDLRFWSLYFGIKPKKTWRSRENIWRKRSV